MTDKDREYFSSLLVKQHSGGSTKLLIDNIMKIITSLTFFGIVTLAGNLISIREELLTLKIQNELVQEFIKEPRFTETNYTNKTAPLQQDMANIQALTNKLTLDVKEVENKQVQVNLKLQKMQIEIDALKE